MTPAGSEDRKGNTVEQRTWRVVRVTPIRPEATREIIAEYDTSQAAWAEHDRLYYHTDNGRGVYYEVVRFDGATV